MQLTPLPTQQINESIEIPEEPEPPIEVPQSTPSRSIEPLKQPGERSRRSSPRPILQAFRAAQHVNKQAWESQLVANKSAIATESPRAFSSAATEASVDVEDEPATPIDLTDNAGLDLQRVPGYNVPLSTPGSKVS